MLGLAERFGGILLSEIYDDITIDDAPYFSALYGPARHAIVVPDLSAVRPMLDALDDCPEDLYLIEGIRNPLMTASSPPKSWSVRCWCAAPIASGVTPASRLCRCSAVRRGKISWQYWNMNGMSWQNAGDTLFDVQKMQRAHQAFSRFVGKNISVAFEADPKRKSAH